MPVHVENHHIERDVVLVDFGHEIDEILLRVALILAVPIAQCIERWQRLAASHLDVIGKGTFVVVAIAKEVVVEGICVNGLCQPGNAIDSFIEGEGARSVATLGLRRLVNERPASTREDAILKIGALIVATGCVEGALRAFQVECIFLTRIPRYGATIERHRDAEVVR